MKKIRLLILICLSLIICVSLVSCTFIKSNEEKINSRIDLFLKAYNSGNMDAVFECLDSKTKNTYKAAMNIGNTFIGKTGFNIKLSDLFGIGIGTMSDSDVLKISQRDIKILNESLATVNIVLTYEDKISSTIENAVFTMIKEDDDWYIKNLESSK